jgi:hypothetical protein
VLAVGDGEEGARAVARLVAMGKRVPARYRGEEGARRARGRGCSPTGKRPSGPIPLNTKGSASVLG